MEFSSDIYDERLENGQFVITWVDELHSPGDKFRQRKIIRVVYKSTKHLGTVVIRRGTEVWCMVERGKPPVRARVVDFPLQYVEYKGKIVKVEFESTPKSRKDIHLNDLLSIY